MVVLFAAHGKLENESSTSELSLYVECCFSRLLRW
jgi:hypothetical protein